ncbi:MAG TPA: anti-phage dCTP deaminase [Terriglobia bacterium]|nr:anti-phage dCTP deaminase [Terriglobia bacterium]
MLLDLKARRDFAELVIGIVGAVGSRLGDVQKVLQSEFTAAGYKVKTVHLIELLHEIDRWETLSEAHEDLRIKEHMDAGDKFRELIDSDDALAILGVGEIRKLREKATGNPKEPAKRTVYILKSLKHPDEIAALREIYGPSFFLVAAYSPREVRIQHLATKIARSYNSYDEVQFRANAEKLVSRDQKDTTKSFGQNVRQSFPMADVFLDSTDEPKLQKEVDRFVRLVLGDDSETPRKDEFVMAHAFTAGLRSGSLSRQVGAAIASPCGEILAVGTNEVPKYRGGQYWPDDKRDHRDIRKQFDSSDLLKRVNVGEVLDRLSEGGWLLESKKGLSSGDRVKEALPLLKNTRIMQPLEYGRAVHAEMAAIVQAATLGVQIRGTTLYSTTFPCHECARHIIAAGILRVVFIEPYPKSLAAQLHEDAIAVETATPDRLLFEPFIGIAPRKFLDLFQMFGDRKSSEGKRLEWKPTTSVLRMSGFPESYIASEEDALELLHRRMEHAKLNAIGDSNAQ